MATKVCRDSTLIKIVKKLVKEEGKKVIKIQISYTFKNKLPNNLINK